MGKLGVVIYTRDGGKTWERQASDDTLGLNLNGVSFVNAQTGWVMTERGSVMLKTEDGGKTRARQFISNTGLRFVSPNPPKDTDGRREESGRGVRELQGK